MIFSLPPCMMLTLPLKKFNSAPPISFPTFSLSSRASLSETTRYENVWKTLKSNPSLFVDVQCSWQQHPVADISPQCLYQEARSVVVCSARKAEENWQRKSEEQCYARPGPHKSHQRVPSSDTRQPHCCSAFCQLRLPCRYFQMAKDVVIRNRISGKLKQQSRAGGSNKAIRPKLLTPFWLTLMSFQVSRGQNMLSPKCQYHLQWSLLLPSQSTQLIFLNRDHLNDYPGIHPFIIHQKAAFHIPEINIYAYCILSKPSTICHLSFCFS